MKKRDDDKRWKDSFKAMVKKAVNGEISWEEVEKEANKILQDLSTRIRGQNKNKERPLFIEAYKALIMVEEAKGEQKHRDSIAKYYLNILEETNFSDVTSLLYILKNTRNNSLTQEQKMLALSNITSQCLNKRNSTKIRECLELLMTLIYNIKHEQAKQKIQTILDSNPHGTRTLRNYSSNGYGGKWKGKGPKKRRQPRPQLQLEQ